MQYMLSVKPLFLNFVIEETLEYESGLFLSFRN